MQDNDEEIGNPRDDDGREIIIQDVLNAVAQKEDMDLEESCFKEVTTKNGKGLDLVKSDSTSNSALYSIRYTNGTQRVKDIHETEGLDSGKENIDRSSGENEGHQRPLVYPRQQARRQALEHH